MSRLPHRRSRRPALLAAAAACAALLGCGDRSVAPGDAERPAPAEQLGIEVLSLRRAASGHVLDLRYRVVDPERARPLLDRRVKPHLIGIATGAELRVPESPKIGGLRQTGQAIVGRTYFVLFANPGGFLARGARAALVVGNVKVGGLTVE